MENTAGAVNIQIAVVYVDGTIRIYGQLPEDGSRRPFVEAKKFNTYGHALQFAIAFEQKQIDEYVELLKKLRRKR